MIDTKEQYESIKRIVLGITAEPTRQERDMFETIEALREVARYCKENAGDEFDEMFPDFPDWLTE